MVEMDPPMEEEIQLTADQIGASVLWLHDLQAADFLDVDLSDGGRWVKTSRSICAPIHRKYLVRRTF